MPGAGRIEKIIAKTLERDFISQAFARAINLNLPKGNVLDSYPIKKQILVNAVSFVNRILKIDKLIRKSLYKRANYK